MHISSLQVPSAKPWTIDTPNLHQLHVALMVGGKAVDVIVVRFGLRVIGVDKATARITINDKIVKLVWAAFSPAHTCLTFPRPSTGWLQPSHNVAVVRVRACC